MLVKMFLSCYVVPFLILKLKSVGFYWDLQVAYIL